MDYKKKFPIFSNIESHYLDTAATAQKPKVVLDKVVEYYENDNGNPGRGSDVYKRQVLDINLVGEYNLYNVLGCVASIVSLGINVEFIVEKLKHMSSVPGRFETIKNNLGARIVVDFAHTDDGLLNVGETLKDITENRVITVFGAGGDRDHDKRPKMAKAAAKFSDLIILTSDNPRTENPTDILNQIEEGLTEINFSKDKYTVIEDREEAIKYAIENILSKGDSLLIAGKGHETYQIIGKEKKHFDDREMARKYCK